MSIRPALGDLLEVFVNRGFVQRIYRCRMSDAAVRFDLSRNLFDVRARSARKKQFCSFGREFLRHSCANRASCTEDDGSLSLQKSAKRSYNSLLVNGRKGANSGAPTQSPSGWFLNANDVCRMQKRTSFGRTGVIHWQPAPLGRRRVPSSW
jgi:hypothetical protein